MMTNEFENQLDAIRIDLYEKTKDMSNAAAVEVANESGKKIAKKYGINTVKGAKGNIMPSAKVQ